MLISSITIGNALRATYHYWQEVLDKSIGACTDNHAASTYVRNNKDIASKALLQEYFMLNGKIDGVK